MNIVLHTTRVMYSDRDNKNNTIEKSDTAECILRVITSVDGIGFETLCLHDNNEHEICSYSTDLYEGIKDYEQLINLRMSKIIANLGEDDT